MTTTVAVSAPEREKKEQGAISRVMGWVVRTAEDYKELDAFLVGLAALKKEIVADFAEAKDKTAKAKRAATEAHKAVADQEEGHLAAIEEARRLGKQKLSDFEEAQRRETARLQAVADAAAETERKRALALANISEKKGDPAKAEALRQEAPAQAPRLAPPVLERDTVVSTRWGATVTDAIFVLNAIKAANKLLVKAKTPDGLKAAAQLLQAEQDAAFLVYNQVALNQFATSTKGAVKLGGVAFSSRKV